MLGQVTALVTSTQVAVWLRRCPQKRTEPGPLPPCDLSEPQSPFLKPAPGENLDLTVKPQGCCALARVAHLEAKSICFLDLEASGCPSLPPAPPISRSCLKSGALLFQGMATTWPWVGLWPSTTGPISARCCRTGSFGAGSSTALRTWA